MDSLVVRSSGAGTCDLTTIVADVASTPAASGGSTSGMINRNAITTRPNPRMTKRRRRMKVTLLRKQSGIAVPGLCYVKLKELAPGELQVSEL